MPQHIGGVHIGAQPAQGLHQQGPGLVRIIALAGPVAQGQNRRAPAVQSRYRLRLVVHLLLAADAVRMQPKAFLAAFLEQQPYAANGQRRLDRLGQVINRQQRRVDACEGFHLDAGAGFGRHFAINADGVALGHGHATYFDFFQQ